MNAAGKPWGIRGLTDNPRAPIVAKAKIGEKGDRGQPKRLDYIIFVEPQTGRRLQEYQAVFGDRPTSFKALLAADTITDMVDVAWKRYGKQGLKCRGDGDRGVDRETGEARQCAGDFGSDGQYACPFANGQNNKAPECKPVLSMRLVVPQIPGLGVVQLDTGGVASSIPTLMWQLSMIERGTNGHMAGIAVNVGIQAFTDRFGNAAYSWILTPLQADAASELRSNIEGLVRIEGQIPKALPPMDEQPDPDIYGIEAPDSRQIGAPSETVAPKPVEPELPEEWTSVIPGAEALFRAALAAVSAPEAKKAAILAGMDHNRDVAAAMGTWEGYHEWLQQQAARMSKQAARAREQEELV